jgi:hypothetical protein
VIVGLFFVGYQQLENYFIALRILRHTVSRASPYHACRFLLMPSGWIGLPQFGGISVSGAIALCRPRSLVLPDPGRDRTIVA